MNLTVFNAALLAYLVSVVVYGLYQVSRRRAVGIAGTALLGAGAALHAAVIVIRWHAAGHPPFVTLFEIIVFFSWCVTCVYLVLEAVYHVRRAGILAALVAVLSLGYASLVDKTISPLMPALQSNWLTVHVVACFVGYAAFSVSYFTALLHLGSSRGGNRRAGICLLSLSFVAIIAAGAWRRLQPDGLVLFVAAGIAAAAVIAVVVSFAWKSPERAPSSAERIVYKSVVFGYFFLTMGIITGAVWANEAWGRYWGWDSKETWSLITWLIYTVFLHGSRAFGWRGLKASWLAVIGFLAVLFTWLGVNYVLSGLHSYG